MEVYLQAHELLHNHMKLGVRQRYSSWAGIFRKLFQKVHFWVKKWHLIFGTSIPEPTISDVLNTPFVNNIMFALCTRHESDLKF